MELNEIAYFTDQVDEMAEFYVQLLGAEPIAKSADMAIFVNKGVKIFLHRKYTPGEGELPPENHKAFIVADVDTVVEDLGKKGITIEIAPNDYYWGRSAYLRDPDGHLIEITEAQG